jgi:hypothetical protein
MILSFDLQAKDKIMGGEIMTGGAFPLNLRFSIFN